MTKRQLGLNAPYGARCFLTCQEADGLLRNAVQQVLMHLMALGAF